MSSRSKLTSCQKVKTNAEKEITDILEKRGADVVIDNTGNVQVIELAYRLTSPTGKTILAGVPRIGNNASIYTLPLCFGKELTGTRGANVFRIWISRVIFVCVILGNFN